MRDDETESHRLERGAPPQPNLRERLADVPIAFSTGGVLAHGVDERLGPEPGETVPAADGTEAVLRGAAAIEAERADAAASAERSADADQSPRSPPSSRS